MADASADENLDGRHSLKDASMQMIIGLRAGGPRKRGSSSPIGGNWWLYPEGCWPFKTRYRIVAFKSAPTTWQSWHKSTNMGKPETPQLMLIARLFLVAEQNLHSISEVHQRGEQNDMANFLRRLKPGMVNTSRGIQEHRFILERPRGRLIQNQEQRNSTNIFHSKSEGISP